jgi:hypothetical protein
LNNSNNLLTLLATDPPSSYREWVPLYLFSCFPHLCWVPADSIPQSRAVLAPYPPPRRPVPRSSGSRQLPALLSGTVVSQDFRPLVYQQKNIVTQSNTRTLEKILRLTKMLTYIRVCIYMYVFVYMYMYNPRPSQLYVGGGGQIIWSP